MEPFRFHLYVCTQQKPEGVPSCAASNSIAMLEVLEKEILQRGLGRDVQLTTCGCMGLCDERPMMVMYPEGVWYRRVQPSDVTEILASLVNGGKPVKRLVWNDAPAMRAMSIEHGEKYRAAKAAREQKNEVAE
jgi:(2Fe-2S) ferredoxin